MDIRVSTYNAATTVTTASRAGNPLATAYVQSAAQTGPVTAAEPIRPVQNNAVAANPSDGYTDSVRGSIINILA